MNNRREYLLEVAALLWAGPAAVGRGSGAGERAFLLIPSAAAPQLVVPAGAPRAAGAAVAGFTGHRSGPARWRSRILTAALRSGIGERLLRDRLVVGADPGVEDHLGRILGQPVLVSMHIGPPRANRKPVLQVLDRRGEVLGFVKVGTGPLTDRLLDTEAEALTALAKASFTSVMVPTLIRHERWRDVDLLVQSPLPVRGTHAPSAAQLSAAMVEVADSAGVVDVAAGSCAYLATLVTELDELGPDGAALASDLRALIAADPAQPVSIGAWHGDWTPWNCSATPDGRLLLWDWERHQDAVPRGLDAMHHHLQGGLGARPARTADATDLVAVAPDLLRPFGLDAEQSRLVAVVYLADIARRYLADGQAAAGGRRGQVGVWIVPAVHEAVAEVSTRRR